jgi:hypothetical protein
MGKIVPRGKLAFLLFALVFVDNLSLIMVRIGFDQAFVNDILKPLTAKLEIASKKCEDKVNRTKADLIERDTLIDALRPEIQRAIELVRNLPHATIQDQKDLGIYIEPHTSNTKPAPGDSPIGKHIPATDGYMKMRALNAKTGKIGPPEGADGWIFAYVVADTPPAHESGYTERIYVSGSLLSVKMEEHIGKKIQCRIYWVNSVGDQSPWSANMEIIIS